MRLTNGIHYFGVCIALGLLALGYRNSHDMRSGRETIEALSKSRQGIDDTIRIQRLSILYLAGITTENRVLREKALQEIGAENSSPAIQALNARMRLIQGKLDSGQAVARDEINELVQGLDRESVDRARAELQSWGDFSAAIERIYTRQASTDRTLFILNTLISVFLLLLGLVSLAKQKAERNLTRQRELHSLLFSYLSEGVLYCKPSGEIVAANQSLSVLLGRPLRAIMGKPVQQLFPELVTEHGVPLGAAFLSGVLNHGRAVSTRTVGFRYPDGRTQWVALSAQPVLDAGKGEGSYSVMFSLSDITETIRTREALEQQQINAFESARLASLGGMAGGIAHEINNPLAVISTSVEQLELQAEVGHELEKGVVLETASLVRRTVERISKITRGLLTQARDGRADRPTKVDLKKLIEETLEFTSFKLKRASVALRFDPIPDSLVVECREVPISQVVLNLVGNAIDAVAERPDRWVHVSVLDRGDLVDIRITDSGSGIPPHLREQILKPFFTTKPVGKGTGLGLSISKQVAEAHGGSLRIDEHCPNTRFVLTLPKLQGAAASARNAA